MPGDHQFLVRRSPTRHAAVRCRCALPRAPVRAVSATPTRPRPRRNTATKIGQGLAMPPSSTSASRPPSAAVSARYLRGAVPRISTATSLPVTALEERAHVVAQGRRCRAGPTSCDRSSWPRPRPWNRYDDAGTAPPASTMRRWSRTQSNPSVLWTLLPPYMAHMLAPLPCATITTTTSDCRRPLAAPRRFTLVSRRRMETVTLEAAQQALRRVQLAHEVQRLAAVKAGLEAGDLARRRPAGSPRRWPRGFWLIRARAGSAQGSPELARQVVDRRPVAYCARMCTTR